MQMNQLQQMRGAPVLDSTGDQIGKVEEIYYDVDGDRPEWIGLGTGFLGTKRVLVPVQSAQVQGDGIQVPFEKDHVKGAPDIDDDELSEETERELYAYYGLGGRGDGGGGQSVTRHEEELAVGTQQVETGQARLRKYVETEPVAMDVELQHETARVTREQIDEPVAAHDFDETEVEVPLHAEQAVVAKQAVAKERIGLETNVETEQQTVRDELRKERVEVEGDDLPEAS